MSAFWSMGGYGWYVWGSYGATLAVLAWNLIAPMRERAALRRRLGEDA
ncbi:MAG TPA: heme exporter protein CcmD [Candidatus Binatia bacterium]|nr:heme exporter protein CcmD [Candidatus Binatia bacterium]